MGGTPDRLVLGKQVQRLLHNEGGRARGSDRRNCEAGGETLKRELNGQGDPSLERNRQR